MKITLKQLVESATAPNGKPSALALVATNEEIPAFPASYWIGKVLKKVNSEMQDYNEARVKIWKEVGATENKETNTFDFTDEQAEAFNGKHKELLATEIELAGVNPVKLESLGGAKIPPAVMSTLDWLFAE